MGTLESFSYSLHKNDHYELKLSCRESVSRKKHSNHTGNGIDGSRLSTGFTSTKCSDRINSSYLSVQFHSDRNEILYDLIRRK